MEEAAGFLDGLVGTIIGILTGGVSRLSGELEDLFSKLAGISLMLAALAYMAHYFSVFQWAIMRLLHLVFWVALFFGYAVLTQQFINYFIWGGLEIGGAVSGGQMSVEDFRRPSVVISLGFVAVAPIVRFMKAQTGWGIMWNSGTNFILLLAWIGIQIAFIAMGFYLAFALVMMAMVTAWTFLTLIFGVLPPLAFLAERGLGLFFASAARLGVAALMIGLTFPYIEQFFLPDAPNIDATRVIWLLIGSWFITGLVIIAPAVTHSFFAGGPALSLSNLIPGAAAVRVLRRAA